MPFAEPVHFSSARQDWATPQAFFDRLNEEFHFTLDAAASPENAKCARYFTEETDGLKQDWGKETVWLNPPYGVAVGAWLAKAYEAARKGATVVCLTFARTDTIWWHDWVEGKAETRFVKGRLKFGGCKNSAPTPSVVLIYRPQRAARRRFFWTFK